MPNCEPLHRDLQVSWEIFGPAITIEVAGRVGKISTDNLPFVVFIFDLSNITADDEYIAFGLSGSSTEARMEGADVAVLYMDTYQGHATDYNITAKSAVIASL